MTQPSDPVPDETPSLVPPPRVPPVGGGLLQPSDGRESWNNASRSLRLRFRFFAVGLFALGVGSLFSLAWALPHRLATFGTALLLVGVQFLRRRHLFRSPQFDLFPSKVYIGAIGGGIVGELVSQLVLHVDPGAPTSLAWLVAGSIGIGGACGIAVGVLCTTTITGFVGGWMVWSHLGRALSN